MSNDPYQIGHQLEVVLSKHKRTDKQIKSKKEKERKAAADAPSTTAATLEERTALAEQYHKLRAEMGLAPAKKDEIS